jgi:L-fuculose-phosphate aldolase
MQERDVTHELTRSSIEAIVREVVTRHLGAMPGTAAAKRAPVTRPRPATAQASADESFASPEALAIRDEIVAVARKLWQRQYVDGNGGNISARLTENTVICTPTMLSKADLTAYDLCLVDLDGNQLAGSRRHSSEILLHLEIFKAVPQAGAVIHCHPPHATAYAITGRVPPGCIVAEHEVFIGPVASVPYETPGTKVCAESVLPYVHDHNTILLANHGVVCWGDTVTHAEWSVEIVDTTCRILILASHLGTAPVRIPADKAGDLLAMKKRLGLPDSRFGLPKRQWGEPSAPRAGIAARPRVRAEKPKRRQGRGLDIERVVQVVTDHVVVALGVTPE